MIFAVNVPQFLRTVAAVSAAHGALPSAWLRATSDIVEANLTVGGRYAPGTPIDTGAARGAWTRQRMPLGEVFTNSAPYIGALERGHSAQAPQGFRGLVELHWPEIQRDGLDAAGYPRLAGALR